ncbi:MAG TPA: prolipoprotein diacylglyceryl transferase [Candidatus Paceibacterota bacterium]|nr:prolipoprotein diacylglyceryl transferase [Candidatus Paceibacterota bacterium]
MFRSIPTPSISEIGLGPLTIHFYALCIVTGIGLAIYLGDRRYQRAGGGKNIVSDVAIAAVPAGIIGGRLYHLITSPDAYFGSNGHPLDAFKIWQGGLGIWGAIALGTFVAWIQHERLKRQGRPGVLSFAQFADALAPGVLLAQAIGRFGNWFNGELFGKPTTLPWGLEIPVLSRPVGYESFQTFQPTFLYEALWCLFVAFLIITLEHKFKPGQSFLFYISAYCVGRFFIESMRIDNAHTIAGLRVNVWVSVVVALGAAYLFWRRGRLDGKRPTVSSDW